MNGRRRFLREVMMTMAAAKLGSAPAAEARARAPRELEALGRAAHWLNSPRLTTAELLGKVVVVDFCTYTCINWLRTLPYVRAWAATYAPGALVVGVHTPEFPFEQNPDNVRRALLQLKVDYPIVIDNDYAIWRAFDNQYWPALYFIDGRGRVRDRHFGEGEYERSERVIQRLRAEVDGKGTSDGLVPGAGTGIEAAADWSTLKSPENYLGYARTARFTSPGGADPDRRRTYRTPARLALNEWALAGEWTMGRQAAVAGGAGGRILCRFHARDVHLVLAPPRQGPRVRFRVSIDGQPPGPARGLDVDDGGNGTVIEPRLYQLIRQPGTIVDRRFEIEFLDPGAEAFAFTFG